MIRWYWRRKPPKISNILAACLFTIIASGMLLLLTVPQWGHKKSDNSHTVAVQVAHEGIYYVGPLVGWFLNHWFVLVFFFLFLSGLVMILYRKDVRRI
jgi:hypothetical protein